MTFDLGARIFADTAPGTTAEELFELLARPAWMADAACKEHPEIDFIPTRGVSAGPAKAVCRGCLVRRECLAYAVADGTLEGVWGGSSALERRRLRRYAA